MTGRSGLGWRFATAGVLVPVLLAVTLWLPAETLFAFVLLAAAAAAWEAIGVVAPEPAADLWDRAVIVALTLGVLGSSTWSLVCLPAATSAIAAGLVLVTMPILVFRPRDVADFGKRATCFVFVPLYVGLGMAVFPVFRYLYPDSGGRWVVLALTIAFFGDTAAYFAGKSIGRHKLHERLSPKKTWEGAIGGIAGSAAAVALAVFWYLPSLQWFDIPSLALAAGAAGQIGDLFESGLKRAAGIKDSGALLPGHGGMLDRIDALLPTGIVLLVYVVVRGLGVAAG